MGLNKDCIAHIEGLLAAQSFIFSSFVTEQELVDQFDYYLGELRYLLEKNEHRFGLFKDWNY